MHIDWVGLHQRSLLGGLGGLFGWGLLVLLVPVDLSNLIRAALTGAFVGLCLGGTCGAWQGIFRDHSLSRTASGVLQGAMVGALGGLLGLFFGEIVYSLADGGLIPRVIGWALFGALVGVSEGVAKRSRQKVLYGAFGGLLGGLIGGSTYEFLGLQLPYWLQLGRDFGGAAASMIGLILLGLIIGAMIGLVEDLLRSAWLTFLSGRLEGRTHTLDSRAQCLLGRSELADVCLLGYPHLATRHARVTFRDKQFFIEPVDGVVLAGPPGNVQQTSGHPLSPGDCIQLGDLRATFQAQG